MSERRFRLFDTILSRCSNRIFSTIDEFREEIQKCIEEVNKEFNYPPDDVKFYLTSVTMRQEGLRSVGERYTFVLISQSDPTIFMKIHVKQVDFLSGYMMYGVSVG